MKYSELISITFEAQKNKPSFSNPCNNCGWCCLTEVCSIGVELSGSKELPCKFMKSKKDSHFCGLALVNELSDELAIGQGCDAKTQAELIKEII